MPSITVDIQQESYVKGHDAYLCGQSPNSNPHTYKGGMNKDRYLWFMGYYDAQLERFYRD